MDPPPVFQQFRYRLIEISSNSMDRILSLKCPGCPFVPAIIFRQRDFSRLGQNLVSLCPRSSKKV